MVSMIPSSFSSIKEQIVSEAINMARSSDSRDPLSILGNLDGAIKDSFDVGNYSPARDPYFNYYSGIPTGTEAFTDVGNVSRDNDLKIAFLEEQTDKIEFFMQLIADPGRLASYIQEQYAIDNDTAFQLASNLIQEMTDKNPMFPAILKQEFSKLKSTKDYLSRVSEMNKTINKKWSDKLGETINSFA